jgi:hypothetical protein
MLTIFDKRLADEIILNYYNQVGFFFFLKKKEKKIKRR